MRADAVVPEKGARFGRLVVIGRPRRIERRSETRIHVLCRCDCLRMRYVQPKALFRGNTKSCGCYHRERATEANLRHGETDTRLHCIWMQMRDRCKEGGHPNWGGRGIRVCEEWQTYEAFRDWAREAGYQDDLEIDRIDVNGHYSPENCRWATDKEQSRNQRRTIRLTAFGETKALADWAEDPRCTVKHNTLSARVQVYGWDHERAITAPVHGGASFAR